MNTENHLTCLAEQTQSKGFIALILLGEQSGSGINCEDEALARYGVREARGVGRSILDALPHWRRASRPPGHPPPPPSRND